MLIPTTLVASETRTNVNGLVVAMDVVVATVFVRCSTADSIVFVRSNGREGAKSERRISMRE